jgi:TonB family protein
VAEPRPPPPDRPASLAQPLGAPPAAAARDPLAIPLPPPPVLQPSGPVYAADGFKKPKLIEAACIQDRLRLPRDVQLEPGETVRVRFAVGLDGQPSEFSLLTTPGDARVGQAIWRAIERCRFTPGTDGKGTPAVLWVVMPFRFDER